MARAESLYETVHVLASNLNTLAHERFGTLAQQLEAVMAEIRQQRKHQTSSARPVYALSELTEADALAVGNKAANLGIMGQLLRVTHS